MFVNVRLVTKSSAVPFVLFLYRCNLMTAFNNSANFNLIINIDNKYIMLFTMKLTNKQQQLLQNVIKNEHNPKHNLVSK